MRGQNTIPYGCGQHLWTWSQTFHARAPSHYKSWICLWFCILIHIFSLGCQLYIYSESYKVMCSNHLQVTLSDGSLQRRLHSSTAITLCPGLVEVIVFGGTTEDYDEDKPDSSYSKIAETTIITFGELASSNYSTLVCTQLVA